MKDTFFDHHSHEVTGFTWLVAAAVCFVAIILITIRLSQHKNRLEREDWSARPRPQVTAPVVAPPPAPR